MSFNLNLDGDPFSYKISGSLTPYLDTTGRTTISPTLDPAKKNFIAIIEGQSLGGNHIPTAYTVQNPTKINCVNWAGDRLLYQHQEPMFGATFYPADFVPADNWSFPFISMWGRVGDLLINSGKFDRIIFLNTTVGGTNVSNREPGALLSKRIPTAFYVLRSLGYAGNQVSAILSMIGESDAAIFTAPESYKASCRALAKVSRSFGFTGPWVTPLETLTNFSVISSAIRQAQADLCREPGFVQGPDFDTMSTSSYRDTTGVHPNSLGHNVMAQMWANMIAGYF